MQHNCACMFVVPHLSLYFLHRSVWFLPSRRAGHHVASPVIWCLVAMRLHTLLCSSQHFLILLRLSSCCGEKESTNRHLDPCYLCTVFSTCFHIFFCNVNALYTVSRLKSCVQDRLNLRINSFTVQTSNLCCRLALVHLHILCLIPLMACCFLSFPFLNSVLMKINILWSEGAIILY